MARYFFHLRNGKTVAADVEGSEHADYNSARAEADESARQLICQFVLDNRPFEGRTLEIADEDGRCLEVISLAAMVRSLLR